ncbi:MAG TPA: hypothetical protein VN701_01470 [Candidatus Paceibacterota bacterium]|nr:hypothetical protein [Candidatus Paceibacterota bacterium]
MSDKNGLSRDVCGALWRLFEKKSSRSSVSVDEVVKEVANNAASEKYSLDEVRICLSEDQELREILKVGGFFKIEHDLLAHA